MTEGGLMMNQSLQNLFDQAMKLKLNFEELKKELAGKNIEILVGNEEVKLTMNGLQEVIDIQLKGEDLPTLQQQRLEILLKRAINQGIARSRKMASEEIANQTGFDPGFFGGMF